MNNLLQSLKSLSPGRLAAIAAILVFLIGFFIYLAVRMNSGAYSVLYTDLELEDAKQIVANLEAANVKYKLAKNGTEILVPEEAVNKLRIDTAEIAMASQGSNVGYEIFDNTDALGSTNFVQNVNLIRALEGELARTIRSVDNIKSARVHLVLPKREMFSREEQKPTASVMIKTINGPIDAKSILSIQKLVAAAVPKLDIKSIAIVDSAGNLLTEDGDNTQNIINAENEVMRLAQEKKLTSQLQSMLEKTVGKGKAQAQVNIEMDFDQVVTNEEIYDPDSKVVRSQSTVSEEGRSTDNVNPVTVDQNIPNGDAVVSGSGVVNQNSKVEETINYEISKVVRNKVRNSGIIKRLTVAVAVDGIYEKNSEGEDVYRSRTPAEMEQLSALVKSAVGYDANRGDSVEVENIRFATAKVQSAAAPEPLYFGFTKDELLRIAEGLGVSIVAVLVILLVIRPLINNAFDTGGNAETDKLIGNGEDNLLLSNFLNSDEDGTEFVNMSKVDGRVKVSSLKKLNGIVEKNPDAAVNIIRSWLYSDN